MKKSELEALIETKINKILNSNIENLNDIPFDIQNLMRITNFNNNRNFFNILTARDKARIGKKDIYDKIKKNTENIWKFIDRHLDKKLYIETQWRKINNNQRNLHNSYKTKL